MDSDRSFVPGSSSGASCQERAPFLCVLVAADNGAGPRAHAVGEVWFSSA